MSKLETPRGNDKCLCPPAFGNMNAANTSFDGWYKQLPISLTSNNQIVVNYEDCSYVYTIEENADRDGDGLPDFLGKRGNVTNWVSVGVSKAVSNVISGLRAMPVLVTTHAHV